MKNNIVVLGGGTAGWLTAMTVKKFHPEKDVTLIESEDIGILGAGEGTTPNIAEAFKFVGISLKDIFNECDGTLKHGIYFNDWTSKNKQYIHEFHTGFLTPEDDNALTFHNTSKYNEYESLSLDYLATQKELCLFGLKDDKIIGPEFYALHFNAAKMAKFLAKKAKEQGIKRVEGIAKTFNQDAETGDITEVVLESGKKVSLDFIFDCSGFARLVIGKHFKSKWKSYSKHLPLDKAIPFFIPHDNNIKPVTEATALKHGWSWKIPVNDRYGCGYVYNSSLISQDQALAEAEEYYGTKLEVPRVIDFNPGCYEETLIQNCLAIGLSAGFVEPLEATSIGSNYINLINFIQKQGLNYPITETSRKFFNNEILAMNEEIVDFLWLHYYGSDRTDSEFWAGFKTSVSPRDRPLEKVELLRDLYIYPDNNVKMFGQRSYIKVAGGLGLLENANFEFKNIEPFKEQVMKLNSQNIQRLLPHKEFARLLNDVGGL